MGSQEGDGDEENIESLRRGALSQWKTAALTTQGSSACPSPPRLGCRNSIPVPRNLYLVSIALDNPPSSAANRQKQVLLAHASAGGEVLGDWDGNVRVEQT